MTQKNIYPKNIFFLETPKSIEIQNFESQKMTRAYICMKISEYPLLPPPPPPPRHMVMSAKESLDLFRERIARI